MSNLAEGQATTTRSTFQLAISVGIVIEAPATTIWALQAGAR
jgi:hypothetical protein